MSGTSTKTVFHFAIAPFQRPGSSNAFIGFPWYDFLEMKPASGSENFSKLNLLSAETGFELLARTPLIPDITATEENLTQIADFLKAQGVRQTRLLAYNPLWHEKNEKIGTHNSFENDHAMTSWIPNEKLEMYRSIYTNKGIHTE